MDSYGGFDCHGQYSDQNKEETLHAGGDVCYNGDHTYHELLVTLNHHFVASDWNKLKKVTKEG